MFFRPDHETYSTSFDDNPIPKPSEKDLFMVNIFHIFRGLDKLDIEKIETHHPFGYISDVRSLGNEVFFLGTDLYPSNSPSLRSASRWPC